MANCELMSQACRAPCRLRSRPVGLARITSRFDLGWLRLAAIKIQTVWRNANRIRRGDSEYPNPNFGPLSWLPEHSFTCSRSRCSQYDIRRLIVFCIYISVVRISSDACWAADFASILTASQPACLKPASVPSQFRTCNSRCTCCPLNR